MGVSAFSCPKEKKSEEGIGYMEVIAALMNKIDSWIWGLPMLVLLCGTHIFMTFRTGFIQRKTLTGIRLSVTKDPDSPGDVSQFQALTTALASTIGTGNIIGVGTAIYLGGPGAVLWCWLTGVFGIATKYAESLIAVKYRVQTADGRMMGGAMYALERGLKWKKFGKVMAVLFALFAMLASFGIGCGTQINAIAEVLETNLPISLPRIAIGIIFGIITAIIIIGGIESIAVVCEKLVPLMALFYVVGCIVILCANYDFLLPALKAIFVLDWSAAVSVWRCSTAWHAACSRMSPVWARRRWLPARHRRAIRCGRRSFPRPAPSGRRLSCA